MGDGLVSGRGGSGSGNRAGSFGAGCAQSAGDDLPAGRGEVFAQLFSVTKDGLVTELDKATHISPQRLLAKYGSLESVLWCGEGAVANKELLKQQSGWQIAAHPHRSVD